MANNRMYLIHRPSGNALYMAKRMGYGWYQTPNKETFDAFFRMLEGEGDQDNFILALEDNTDAPHLGTCCRINSVDDLKTENLTFFEWIKE